MIIEPLESRIAPAAVFTYTDADGDLVTIKTSKGTNADLASVVQPHLIAGGVGFKLDEIDLSLLPAVFDGTDLTVTAKPQDITPGDGKPAKSGDGAVNVGKIDADAQPNDVDGTAINLGKVVIGGDLGAIIAGTNTPGTLAVKSLTVGSIGVARVTDFTVSVFHGSVGPVTIKGNFHNSLSVRNGGNLASLTIGGSIIGSENTRIDVDGNLGALVVKGDIQAVPVFFDPSHADDAASITVGGDIASVFVGGSMLGSNGEDTARISAGDAIGPVTIKGSLLGGSAINAGSIHAVKSIGNVTIGGSVVGEAFNHSGAIYVDDPAGTIGAVKIGHDLDRGRIDADGGIGAVKIGGSLIGGSIIGQGEIVSDLGAIGAITIGGSVIGGSTDLTGVIRAEDIASIAIGGSVLGGSGTLSGYIRFYSSKSVTIGGDLRGGTASNTGQILSYGNIGILKIGGDLRGTEFSDTGSVQADEKIKSVTIGGSILGGSLPTMNTSATNTGNILAGHLGSVTVAGSVIAGIATEDSTLTRSGSIIANFEIGSIAIKGGLLGNYSNLATIFSRGLEGDPVANNFAMKSVKIGGNVEHAWIFGGVDAGGAGVNGNAQIGSVKVGGDWIASSLGTGVTSGNGVIGDGGDSVIGLGTRSKIASIVIGGAVLGIGRTGETFGIFAHEIGSFKYHGLAVPLLPGAGNDTFPFGAIDRSKALGPSLSPATGLKPDGFAVHVYEV